MYIHTYIHTQMLINFMLESPIDLSIHSTRLNGKYENSTK